MGSADTALRALDERLDKLRTASDELKATTRDAHAATKELKRVAKEVRDLLALEPAKAVAAVMENAVKVGLEGYTEEIKQATDAARDAVDKSFDELAGILLGYERRTEATIGFELAKRSGMDGRCAQCGGDAVVRRYAIAVDALDVDEQPVTTAPYLVLERYACQRTRDHYGTVIVGTTDHRRLEAELGPAEAQRHSATLERDAAEVTAALTTDTEET